MISRGSITCRAGTILAAIDDLQAEGYLESRRGSGTYVSKILPEHLLQSQRAAEKQANAAMQEKQHLSAFASRIRPFSYYVHPTSTAFRTNLPALDLFPTALWAEVAARRLRKASIQSLLGCGPLGYLPLREAVARYARSSRGVSCVADQVVIVSGIQEGLDLTARLFLDPGDKVLVRRSWLSGSLCCIPVRWRATDPCTTRFRGRCSEGK